MEMRAHILHHQFSERAVAGPGPSQPQAVNPSTTTPHHPAPLDTHLIVVDVGVLPRVQASTLRISKGELLTRLRILACRVEVHPLHEHGCPRGPRQLEQLMHVRTPPCIGCVPLPTSAYPRTFKARGPDALTRPQHSGLNPRIHSLQDAGGPVVPGCESVERIPVSDGVTASNSPWSNKSGRGFLSLVQAVL